MQFESDEEFKARAYAEVVKLQGCCLRTCVCVHACAYARVCVHACMCMSVVSTCSRQYCTPSPTLSDPCVL